jgi:aminopeptidase N
MKKNILFIILFISTSLAINLEAQSFEIPINNFATAENPLYWKNRKPHAAYWQQDVHYIIEANIDEKTDIVSGEMWLEYTNNSPDELPFVFFHLYQNAFQPGSYFDNLNKNNDIKPKYGKYESSGLGTSVESIEENNILLKTEIDNTVLKVYLTKALAPNSKTTLHLKFKTYYDAGGLRRRMKIVNSFGTKEYNGAQWYPKLSVYDAKFGWDVQQHLNHEFYGDFGTFDVALTFASNYVVEATGTLQNQQEVLPDTLRKKLDIKNFENKPWGEKPSVIIPYKEGERKTWIYHAENVHDFAYVASPHFRLGESEWNGIKTIAVVLEQHASGWKNAADYTAKIIQVFSEDFGMYGYPKMIVADASDGMEYPMLTMDGGKDPGYRSLLVHEVGHNWFYGMIGNNETYRALLDEGFTQFITAWGLERIDGKYPVTDPIKNKYVKYFTDSVNVWESSVYWGYMRDAIRGEDPMINTHSDDFSGAVGHGGGYRHVYSKTSTMLRNMQYVLGDSLFSAAMKHYFNQWKFAHPYPEDFRNSIIQFTHVDLNWFFDEWMETSKNIDYSIEKIKKSKVDNQYKITFRRIGEAQMPIDFTVTDKKNQVHNFYIPNTWFEKKMDSSTTILPRWIGWGEKLKPVYTATVTIPNKIKNVEIDPSKKLADIDALNNSKKLPIKFKFDSRINNFPDRNHYMLYMAPNAWYNAFDGIKAGISLRGNYLNYKHIFNLKIWYNTRIGRWNQYAKTEPLAFKNDRWSIDFDYSTATDKILKNSSIGFGYRFLDGLQRYYFTLNKSFPKYGVNTYISFFSLYRKDAFDIEYDMNPDAWDAGKYNRTLNLGTSREYARGIMSGSSAINFRTTALMSDYDFHLLNATIKNNFQLWRLKLRTRLFGQIGSGKNWAGASSLYFAGASPEDMLANKYTRAKAFFPQEWLGYDVVTNHFHYGGGLNLRGYSGYYVVEKDKAGNAIKAYQGTGGASINVELEFDNIINWRPKKISEKIGFDAYLFADAGTIQYRNSLGKIQNSKLRADAGLGLALTIKRWGALQNTQPFTIRCDFPLYLSDVPFAEKNNFMFRWMIGVSRAF